MYKNKRSRDRPFYIAAAIGSIIAIYIALCIAPYSEGGLPSVMQNAEQISFNPFLISWTQDTPKTIMGCLLFYGIIVVVLFSYKRRLHRSGVENGSADYADIKKLRKEFHSTSSDRIVYTENFALSVTKADTFIHKRNYNTVLIGGPGSGKTTGYVYPNLLEASASYVVLDPKGEVCRNTAGYLQSKGYAVKVLNLVNPSRSWGYNPFAYIRKDTDTDTYAEDDIQKIVTAIYKATTAPNSQTIDPFWDEAGKMLLSALMYLLYYFGAEDEKNFPYLMNLIRAGRIENSEDDEQRSALDILFQSIEQRYPDHICVRCYKNATSGAGKTQQSVQITLLARLQKYEISSVAAMSIQDELELSMIADKPTVLYLVIPDNDTSYNFIVSLLYIQLFQTLYDKADRVYQGRLPRFVHIIMEEFANVNTPDDFLGILATSRSRNIGISIILQNFSQLKTKYKEGWENIIGLCDEFLYLGGNESSTHEYVSKMLGKETIDTTTFGRRYGMHGDASSNFQFAGRELLTPEEVRVLPYEQAILFIKNALPLIDRKIDVFHYKPAENTAICGNEAMTYSIPLRSERLHSEQLNKQNNEQSEVPLKDIFEATAVGDNQYDMQMEFFVNGRRVNITDLDVSEMLEMYSVDIEELEAYIQNFT